MRFSLAIAAAGSFGAFCAYGAVAPDVVHAQSGRTHALIVVGIGGTAEYRESFHAEASEIYTALTTTHGLAKEDVIYLGERVETAPEMISDTSTRAHVLEVLGELSQRIGPTDRVLVILIGHGTDQGGEAQLNVPGPDLTPSDFELASVAFPSQPLALVHTGSASGGWVEPLAGPNRIVIAATRTAREQNATEFGQFFAQAIAGNGADLDHDNRVSLLEAFLFAKQEVERYYQEENELLTEHAVLEDNGDGEGSSDASQEGPDGVLASTFALGGAAAAARTTDDPVLARLYEERDGIQRQIDELRVARAALTEDQYLERMEPLLVELALKNREIREAGGGV
ncbi:MAG: hypothetical protein AB7T31_12620 [Gemmatimonadales bacterium]